MTAQAMRELCYIGAHVGPRYSPSSVNADSVDFLPSAWDVPVLGDVRSRGNGVILPSLGPARASTAAGTTCDMLKLSVSVDRPEPPSDVYAADVFSN